MPLKTAHALLFAGLAAFAAAEALAQDAARPPADRSPASDPVSAVPGVKITVRGADTEEEVKGRLRADSLLKRCQIKPVMTDAEIELCKTAYRQTDRYEPPRR